MFENFKLFDQQLIIYYDSGINYVIIHSFIIITQFTPFYQYIFFNKSYQIFFMSVKIGAILKNLLTVLLSEEK